MTNIRTHHQRRGFCDLYRRLWWTKITMIKTETAELEASFGEFWSIFFSSYFSYISSYCILNLIFISISNFNLYSCFLYDYVKRLRSYLNEFLRCRNNKLLLLLWALLVRSSVNISTSLRTQPKQCGLR